MPVSLASYRGQSCFDRMHAQAAPAALVQPATSQSTPPRTLRRRCGNAKQQQCFSLHQNTSKHGRRDCPQSTAAPQFWGGPHYSDRHVAIIAVLWVIALFTLTDSGCHVTQSDGNVCVSACRRTVTVCVSSLLN